MIIVRRKDGTELWPREDELLSSGVNLPRHLFVIGCGGCSANGRALCDREGVELFRETWPDDCKESEYDAALSAFYERVKTEVEQ